MTAATVDVLTAEVRALMIGSRQVTLSVFRQLDCTDWRKVIPFGRVNANKNLPPDTIEVVGADRETGALVASALTLPKRETFIAPTLPCSAEEPDTWTPSDEFRWRWEDAEGIWVVSADGRYALPDEREGPSFTVQAERPSSRWSPAMSGRVRIWADPELIQADFRESTAETRAERVAWADWNALPLIVLAGLR